MERGPVLYEAYYPEEQEIEVPPSPSIYQEKRYFDRGVIPERSHQISADPYEIPDNYESEFTKIREEYHRPDSGYLSAFTAARPQTVQNKEYIFADQPSNDQANENHFRSRKTDLSFPESHSNFYGNDEIDQFDEENRMNYGEDVQRIVPIRDEYVFGEQPAIREPNFNELYRNFRPQNFGADYSRAKPIESMPIENIFEPRPQTLNYVFSTPTKGNVVKPVKIEPETDDNDWPRNYGDNLIQEEIVKADEQALKNEEAKIASIEVSQVPHHKIRHHHGELPKRNYNRH